MKFLTRSAAVLVAVATLSAAGPGSAVPAKPDDKTILHVLNPVGFGPRPGDVERVRAIGLSKYIDEQLTPERIPDSAMTARLAGFETLSLSSRKIAEDYYLPAQEARRRAQMANKNAAPDQQNTPQTPARPRTPQEMEMAKQQREVMLELSAQKILRAAYSDRQLEEVMTDFWFNHFNVFAGKGATQEYLTEYERDAIRPHVLGKFRDLLGATAKSPAMLFYLDNWQSADPDATERMQAQRARGRMRFGLPPQPAQNPNAPKRQKRGLNENYGRELMELHTLGVDGGYTQEDVVNVARAFTGWTIEQPRQGAPFRFEPRLHDERDKVVLGHRIKGGGGQ